MTTRNACWAVVLLLSATIAANAQDQAIPFLRSKQRITILSANDGLTHLRTNPEDKKVTQDSITVIHLGPDHPPIVKTVYGTVPNTISGPPYMAMTGDGRYGFVTSRKIKQEPEAPEIISVIDLASPDLKVVQTVKLPDPRMAVMHPDGKRLLIPYDTGIRVFEMRGGKLELVKDNPTEFRLLGIDISPRRRSRGRQRHQTRRQAGGSRFELPRWRNHLPKRGEDPGGPARLGRSFRLPIHHGRPADHHSQRLAQRQQGQSRTGVHRRPRSSIRPR